MDKSWCPRHIPKIGMPALRNSFIFSIAYSQGSGSPGPFDKKMPFGDFFITSSKEVLALTTSTFPTDSVKSLRIFFLIPKS